MDDETADAAHKFKCVHTGVIPVTMSEIVARNGIPSKPIQQTT